MHLALPGRLQLLLRS